METTSFEHIAYLADFCAKNGIKKIVLSPGSRNAPIITAFESHPDIQTYLIHDERAAAFFALGLIDAAEEPVALTCTSGSALLNYSPALVEAYYRQKPLLVLSADRPAYLIDQGDGQTIRQEGVYANFIKSAFSISTEDEFGSVENKCVEMLESLCLEPRGPVHVNLPLDEPLYKTVDWDILSKEITLQEVGNQKLSSEQIELWKSTEKKLIIVGQGSPNKRLEQLLKQLGENPSVAILVENTSNMQDFKSFCHCIDRTLAAIDESEKKDFAPDLLISIGGAVISKRIKVYFRAYKATHNWRVGKFLIEADTYQSMTASISSDPALILQELVNADAPALSNFGSKWKQKDFLAQEAHLSFCQAVEYSDLAAFNLLLDIFPDDAILHMGNSSVVRYCQLFNPVQGTQYYSNRGVSGIDGSASTAAGFSSINPSKLNILIEGDISFFYDSNAFWNPYLQSNLKVIVISNGGGGIFQIIPGPAESAHSNTFFAPTSASVSGICEAYDLNYYRVESLDEISQSVEEFFKIEKNNRPSVMEICTDNAENARVLAEYFTALADQKA